MVRVFIERRPSFAVIILVLLIWALFFVTAGIAYQELCYLPTFCLAFVLIPLGIFIFFTTVSIGYDTGIYSFVLLYAVIVGVFVILGLIIWQGGTLNGLPRSEIFRRGYTVFSVSVIVLFLPALRIYRVLRDRAIIKALADKYGLDYRRASFGGNWRMNGTVEGFRVEIEHLSMPPGLEMYATTKAVMRIRIYGDFSHATDSRVQVPFMHVEMSGGRMDVYLPARTGLNVAEEALLAALTFARRLSNRA